MPGVQEPELFDDEEQEDDHGSPGVLKVLQHLPQAHASQRDEVGLAVHGRALRADALDGIVAPWGSKLNG